MGGWDRVLINTRPFSESLRVRKGLGGEGKFGKSPPHKLYTLRLVSVESERGGK